MAALQTVAFGAASDGSQGDSVRTGFTKHNSNVAALQAQAALTTYGTITAAQALTVAHVGKRININLSTAGTINVPSAATCAADNVILLRNTGAGAVTLAVTAGSGDSLYGTTKLNPTEVIMLDTDGVHSWNVLMRGRSNYDNEVVNGNCTVNGNETVSGTLTVAGVAAFSQRPTFAGNTAWDSGNFNPAQYAALNTQASFSGPVYTVGLNGYAPANNQGSYLVWNEGAGGAGATSLVNNQGAGSGGFIFRNINLANTAETGRFTITAAGVGGTGSDVRLKEDVETLTDALAKVRQLRGVSYRYKANGEAHYGVIAQEVQAVYPNAVMSQGYHPVDDTEYLGVAYTDLIGPLIEAVKQLADDNDALTVRLAALEAKQ